MATAGEEALHEESNENQAHPEGTRAEIYVFVILVFKEGFFLITLRFLFIITSNTAACLCTAVSMILVRVRPSIC